jgi:hypothetical protein
MIDGKNIILTQMIHSICVRKTSIIFEFSFSAIFTRENGNGLRLNGLSTKQGVGSFTVTMALKYLYFLGSSYIVHGLILVNLNKLWTIFS